MDIAKCYTDSITDITKHLEKIAEYGKEFITTKDGKALYMLQNRVEALSGALHDYDRLEYRK